MATANMRFSFASGALGGHRWLGCQPVTCRRSAGCCDRPCDSSRGGFRRV